MRPHVFLSYSHRDARILQDLLPYLQTLQQGELIAIWTDMQIEGGDSWRAEIDAALDAASIAVLLISQDFLASQFINREELPRILQRQRAGRLKVLPVFLRPSTVTSEAIRFSDEHGKQKSIKLTELQGFGKPEKTLQELKPNERARQFIGLHDRIRQLVVATTVSDDPKERISMTEGLPVIASVMTTTPVRFDTERLPNPIDLQRSIHQILSIANESQKFSIPLNYDSRLDMLHARVQAHYANYESETREANFRPLPSEHNSLYNAIRGSGTSLDNLPQELGAFASRLRYSRSAVSAIFITRACSRLVELRLTSIIIALSSYQFTSDDPPVFLEYVGLRAALDYYIAKIDAVSVDRIVSYRMVRMNDAKEDVIFAPIDYGRRRLWLKDDIKDQQGYTPPISFLTDYVFPQTVWWYPEEDWNFDGSYRDIFVKDRNGEYI